MLVFNSEQVSSLDLAFTSTGSAQGGEEACAGALQLSQPHPSARWLPARAEALPGMLAVTQTLYRLSRDSPGGPVHTSC